MFGKFFLNDNNIEKQAILWNTLATITSSFQTMLLLLVLTHHKDFVSASIITIGYSVANLSMTVAKYGIRNFQVSDVQEKYTFAAYLRARYVTFLLALLFALFYGAKGLVFNQYTWEKAIAVVLLCIYKGIESYEDVYHGRLQQMNRLDIGMRILAVRNIVFILEFILVYCLTENLLWTLVVSVATTLVLAVWLNRISDERIYFQKIKTDNLVVWTLLKESLPVALAAFLLMYLGNAPKYIMDSVVTDEEQTYFNIIFMVTFAVNLVSTFVFNPFLRRMALLWDEREVQKFEKYILRILLYILAIVVAGMVFATIIGRKLLGWIYAVSLEEYKLEVLLMLAAGGTLAILNLMNLLLVLIRKQKVMMLFCAISAIVLVLFGEYILIHNGLTGLIILYLSVLSILDMALLIALKLCILKRK